MKLFVKYMVSLESKRRMKEELKKLALQYVAVDSGLVEIMEEITPQKRQQIKERLIYSGWELLDDKRSILIEEIEKVITGIIHSSDELPKVNYSDCISEKLGQDFTYLAKIFAEVKGVTIHQFIIIHKIEKVKELLLYSELSLAQISCKVHYSSPAHLSSQFRQITGLSPSFYKKLKRKRERNLKNM